KFLLFLQTLCRPISEKLPKHPAISGFAGIATNSPPPIRTPPYNGGPLPLNALSPQVAQWTSTQSI
ncbi:hypothetical protein, partial [Pseudomonas aeruginosa]|uniref:hypothetical protein n=1 Tax=Pseudomonas aeruginosa TaxID=287 RepID=UPI003D297314